MNSTILIRYKCQILDLCEPIYDYFESTHWDLLTVDDDSLLVPATTSYKKARKRRQNRESAVRFRARKKVEKEVIDATLEEANSLNNVLATQNVELKSENEILKRELDHDKSLLIKA